MEDRFYNSPRLRYKAAPVCPCGRENKDGKFSPFRDGDGSTGHCHSCGETFLPPLRREAGEGYQERPEKARPATSAPGPDGFMHFPLEAVQAARKLAETSALFTYMARLLGREATLAAFNDYQVGGGRHWPGASAFPLIDGQGVCRGVKLVAYDSDTGKRIKEGGAKVVFAHGLPAFKHLREKPFRPCLFGAHLALAFPSLPLVIVESEKTALACHITQPLGEPAVYLATGGKGVRFWEGDFLPTLAGREVILLPDQDGAEAWQGLAAELARTGVFTGVDVLTGWLEDAGPGEDIADLIFREAGEGCQEQPEAPASHSATIPERQEAPARGKPSQEAAERLEACIQEAEEAARQALALGVPDFYFPQGGKLLAAEFTKFVATHAQSARANLASGKDPGFCPYYRRLATFAALVGT